MSTNTVLGIIEFLGKMLFELIRAHRKGDQKRVEEILGSELGVVLAKHAADAAAEARFPRSDESRAAFREDPTIPFARAGLTGDGHE